MALFESIRFTPGRPLTKELGSERLNTILTEIKRNKPKGERGISVRQDGTGTYIGLAASLPQGGSSAPAVTQPWDLVARVDPDADPEDATPPYLVRVRPGTANGILPSNWDEEFEYPGTGLFYAKAVIATDGEAITGVTIEIDDTTPTVQEPQEFGIATSMEYLFGLFSEGQVYRVIGAGQIVLPTRTWLVTGANPVAAPGESPYDIYYLLGP
jgi:hypothetical protein